VIDAQLEGFLLNRSMRGAAPEAMQPKQTVAAWAQVREEFFAQREETLRMVKDAKTDLRAVRSVHRLGEQNLDAHQWVLVVALHNLRHLEQMVETRRADLGILRRLSGRWSGAGRYIRPNARLETQWEPILNGRFARLDLKVSDANGEFFWGQAIYRVTPEGKYAAQWFDSNGNVYPVTGKEEGMALVADWGQGRSTYRLLDNGEMEEIDEVKTASGAYQEFARVRLVRATQ
jgi:hypothetical protein